MINPKSLQLGNIVGMRMNDRLTYHEVLAIDETTIKIKHSPLLPKGEEQNQNVAFADIQPVFITKEILQSIGAHNPNDNEFVFSIDGAWFLHIKAPERTTEAYFATMNSPRGQMSIWSLTYLHNLQNLLSLFAAQQLDLRGLPVE